MAPANTIDDTFIPEFLYHTCLTVDEHDVQTLEDIPRLYVLGSHGTLEAAKKCALKALATLGYEEADFALYQTRPHGVEEWEHGNGTIVYAKAPAGQEFLVRIDTKLNIEDLPALPDGSLRLPEVPTTSISSSRLRLSTLPTVLFPPKSRGPASRETTLSKLQSGAYWMNLRTPRSTMPSSRSTMTWNPRRIGRLARMYLFTL
uniref:Uncharacterized protein n=1 Tax=Bionectria ochroleuca TaxID=29856 RepID=A0A8H7N2W9_BIOOC